GRRPPNGRCSTRPASRRRSASWEARSWWAPRQTCRPHSPTATSRSRPPACSETAARRHRRTAPGVPHNGHVRFTRIADAMRSVRSRILTAILLVTALGMTLAGGAAYLLQRERVLGSIDEKLTQTVDGLQFIADGGETGQEQPATVSDFLTQAMQRV